MAGLMMMIAGSSLLVFGGKYYQLNQHLDQVGIQAEAYVHSIDEPSIDFSIRIDTFLYKSSTNITICFQNNEGKWLAAQLKGLDSTNYALGDKLQIRYDPACPTDCLIDDGARANWSPAGTILVMLLGFGLLGYGLYQFLVTL